MTKSVYVGVGHGGTDAGACANGLKESELALDIAKVCYDELIRHGVKAVMSRTTQGSDAVDDLIYKIERCNAYGPDLAVDIHINAGNGNGFEAFYYHGGGTSLTMAKNIETEVVAMGQNTRGLKTRLNDAGNDYFGWIRQVDAPSVILEAAFIDNDSDVQMINTHEGRRKFGVAYAKGLLRTLGIEYKESGTAAPAADTTAPNSALEPVVYKDLADIPGFAKETITKLIDLGALQGDANGHLNLPHEIVRMYVVHDRLGLYD